MLGRLFPNHEARIHVLRHPVDYPESVFLRTPDHHSLLLVRTRFPLFRSHLQPGNHLEHPHPFRHVPLQPYVCDEQRTTLKTKTPTVFFNNERDRCLLLMFYFAHKRHETAVISLYLKIMFLCFFLTQLGRILDFPDSSANL